MTAWTLQKTAGITDENGSVHTVYLYIKHAGRERNPLLPEVNTAKRTCFTRIWGSGSGLPDCRKASAIGSARTRARRDGYSIQTGSWRVRSPRSLRRWNFPG